MIGKKNLGFLAGFLAWLILSPATTAGPIDPPARVMVTPNGEPRLRGFLTAYDQVGFDFRDTESNQRRFRWADLDPAQVLWLHERFLDPDDAAGWFDLAASLYGREGGREPGERALQRSLRVAPELADKAAQLRAGESVTFDDPPEVEEPAEDKPESNGPEGPRDGELGEGGPVTKGDIQAAFWGELPDQVMASSIEQTKRKMQEVMQTMNHRLTLFEDQSDFFLFYSDLPPKEAANWAKLLDRMYVKLCDTFGIPNDQNIFRGKCLIVVFARQADYYRYHALVNGFQAQGTAGLCVQSGDGFVEVTFYRQPDPVTFARVLVHEAVHGFLHRYRSYHRITSWINEGLAEYISASLVEDQGFGESEYARQLDYGLRMLREHRTLGGSSFFHADHISAWQYPVTQMLTGFMVQQSRTRYRDFINAIKDGKDWESAIQEDYGLSVEQLVAAFGQSIRIRDLRP